MKVMVSSMAFKGTGILAGVVILIAACVVTVRRGETCSPSLRDRSAQQATVLGGDGLGAPLPGGAAAGQVRYQQACAMCHGVQGQGMPHQGPSLRDSAFVTRSNDADLGGFIKTGRPATDPHSVMKLVMPPRGGNPALTDLDITEIVHHLRTMQAEAQPTAAAPAAIQPGS
jgi:disulfide bond formation protein DsbB